MSPFNCHRLAVGQFHGTVLRTRTITGIRLTEDVYPRDLRAPPLPRIGLLLFCH